MWYAATDLNESEFNIGYAFSVNGINWQRDTLNNPVLEVGSPGSWDEYAVSIPFVHRIDSTYYMWYFGWKNNPFYFEGENIKGGLAFSNDGIHWTKYDDPATISAPYAESDPVLMPSPGQWDGSNVVGGSVLVFGDTLHLWYDGWRLPSPPNPTYIGHATMPIVLLPVGIEDYNSSKIPQDYSLKQNYPNPFNPSTTIEITLPKSEFVELKVYNILGKEVATLVSIKLNQGNHTYTFDGKNLASGIYYYQLVAGDYREVKKMILLR